MDEMLQYIHKKLQIGDQMYALGHLTLEDQKKMPSFSNNADAIEWF